MSTSADTMLPPPTTAERRYALAAAISSVTVFGFGIALGGPLLSLILEARGTDATLTGLNAAATFVGVMVGPLLTPGAVRWLGIRRLLLTYLAADAAVFLMMRVFDNVAAWFLLRATLGLIGSTIFVATEAWINQLADDAGRGRVIGLYIAALSAGFGGGPLLLSVTGIEGWTPFLAAAGIVALATIPLIGVPERSHDPGRDGGSGNVIAVFAKAPFILLATALAGFYEQTTIALLPVWGLRSGLSTGLAAACLAAVYFGAIALQVPLGWLSDHVARLRVLRLCAATGVVGAALVLAIGGAVVPLFAVLFVWGGVVTGIYPVALSMAGERFAGSELVTANAAIVMSYGLGGLAGPALGGAAMDLWNPHGLPALLLALFAMFLVATVIKRARPRAR
jgi:MFS family permease